MKQKQKQNLTQNIPTDFSAMDEAFQNACGKIPFNMTNDYMFRAVLQESNQALRGLICSLLHLAESEVTSVEITNPIILGETVDAKEFRLDIHLLLNDNTLIDLEMQIANRLNWQNRSVMYLCRSYDRLNRGQEYRDAKPAIHIGFLDYTLFSNCPEFYACYKLINITNYQVYSNNLTLYVADLSRIDLATEEDKDYHIDSWARLFKAATWEELKMTASEDDALYAAAKALFYKNSDEEIRMRCLDRDEYYADLQSYERAIAEKEQDLRSYQTAIAEKEQQLELDRMEHEQDLRNYQKAIAEKEQQLELGRMEHEQNLRSYEKTISEQALQIEQLRAEIERIKKDSISKM